MADGHTSQVHWISLTPTAYEKYTGCVVPDLPIQSSSYTIAMCQRSDRMHLYWPGNEARFILRAEFCVKREEINQSTEDDLFSVIRLCRH